MRLTILTIAALATAAPALAGPVLLRPALPRTEVPIRAVVLSDGARRYAVTVRIAGREVEAGLDSGSTGLRVLPRALSADALQASGPEVRYSFDAGATFDGRAIAVPVGIGAQGEMPVRIQRIDRLGCKRDKPDCAATRVSGDAFGIQGDGLAGEGFAAILGVGLKADAVPNTLQALGARRWIIDLPRPGDSTPGRLVLDPTDEEVAAYRRVAMLGDDGNMVAGCLSFASPLRPVCGPARLDTGAPGLRVVSADPAPAVPQGAPARLTIGDKAGDFGIDLVVGRREQASRLTFERNAALRTPQLFFGLAPYFAWSVLYDPAGRTIGLKQR